MNTRSPSSACWGGSALSPSQSAEFHPRATRRRSKQCTSCTASQLSRGLWRRNGAHMCAHMHTWVLSACTAEWRRANPRPWGCVPVHSPISERHFLQAHNTAEGHLPLTSCLTGQFSAISRSPSSRETATSLSQGRAEPETAAIASPTITTLH